MPCSITKRRCPIRTARTPHIAIDIATGVALQERYWLTEEIGRALNPAMVQGQAVGGNAGLGGTFRPLRMRRRRPVADG